MSKKFKIGDLVTVNSTSTGIRKDETVQKFGLEMGQEVRLIRYDPQDETWLVQGKDGSWPAVWIKRRCLKPLEAVAAQPTLAFKIGDNVQVGTDETIYTIEQHPSRANDVNITWPDPSGKQSTAYTKAQINEYLTKENPMWRLVTPKAEEPKPVEAPSFKVGDKVRLIDGKIKSAAQDGWIKSDKIKRDTTYTVARIMEESSGDVLKVEPEHGARGIYWIRMDSFVPAPVEKPVAPKPAEAKKPRLMLCVDMTGNSAADYTVGKVYELKSEDEQYYYFKRNDGGVRGSLGGMFKHRFIEIKDEVENSVKVLCINNSGGYEDLLTVGKTYEAVPLKDGEELWTIPVSDKGTQTTAYKHRFTVLTEETTAQPISKYFNIGDRFKCPGSEIVYLIKQKINSKQVQVEWQSPRHPIGQLATMNFPINQVSNDFKAGRWIKIEKRTWKVGDTVTSKFLNDSEIEKEFHGYDKGWNKYSSRMFVKDRKIEEIGEREGKTGARISGTMDIWITIESLEKHP